MKIILISLCVALAAASHHQHHREEDCKCECGCGPGYEKSFLNYDGKFKGGARRFVPIYERTVSAQKDCVVKGGRGASDCSCRYKRQNGYRRPYQQEREESCNCNRGRPQAQRAYEAPYQRPASQCGCDRPQTGCGCACVFPKELMGTQSSEATGFSKKFACFNGKVEATYESTGNGVGGGRNMQAQGLSLIGINPNKGNKEQ